MFYLILLWVWFYNAITSNAASSSGIFKQEHSNQLILEAKAMRAVRKAGKYTNAS